jgi:hypothetical protein
VVAELWPCAGLLTTTKTSMNHFEGGNTHESELLTNMVYCLPKEPLTTSIIPHLKLGITALTSLPRIGLY